MAHISFWKWKKSAIERIDDLITEVDQIRGKFGNGELNSSVLTIDLSNVGTTTVQPTGLTPNNSFQDLKGNCGVDLILIHWCWRRNLLLTTLRCCGQFSSLLTPKSSGAQHLKNGTNERTSYATSLLAQLLDELIRSCLIQVDSWVGLV